MFQTNKNSYRVVVICTNGDKEGRYTVIEDYDDNWDTIAEQMFFNEFGEKPTEMRVESRERI